MSEEKDLLTRKGILAFILLVLMLVPIYSNVAALSMKTSNVKLISASNLQSVTGEPNSKFGEMITSIGDYNLDGNPDFIIGGRQYNGWQGRAWVYYTGSKGIIDGTSAFNITGEPNRGDNGICFGHSIANVGDVNQDGIDDFVVGGPGSWGTWDVGRMYLFYGNTTSYSLQAGSDANQTFESPIKFDWFGETVSYAKDFNGDGIGDLVVGAPGNPTGGTPDFGSVYIYFGNNHGFSATPDLTLRDNLNNTGFGLSLSTGDVNGDGLTDILVGAPNFSTAEGDIGQVYVFYGKNESNKVLSPDVTIKAPSDADTFGNKVQVVKSVNNDNYDDILIQYHEKNSVMNKVALYLGKTSSNYSNPDLILSTDKNADNFGISMLGLGDINNDGYNDFAIGASGLGDQAQNSPGYVYVYYGNTTISSTPSLAYEGENPGDGFGFSIGKIAIKGAIQMLIGSITYKLNVGRVYLTLNKNITEPIPTSSISFSLTSKTKSTPGFDFLLLNVGLILVVITKKKKRRNY